MTGGILDKQIKKNTRNMTENRLKELKSAQTNEQNLVIHYTWLYPLAH